MLKWFKSYLNDRSQQVKLGDSISTSIKALPGVPRGEHLSPLLFLLFINDVTNTFENGKFLIFATTLFAKLFN